MRNVSRSMSLVIVIFFLPVLILSCSSAREKNYESHVSSFLGVAEGDLVQKWGPPQEAYESGGRKYLKYSFVAEKARENNRVSEGSRGSLYGSREPSFWSSSSQFNQPKSKICVTTFELVESKVVAYEWEGNNCVAP